MFILRNSTEINILFRLNLHVNEISVAVGDQAQGYSIRFAGGLCSITILLQLKGLKV